MSDFASWIHAGRRRLGLVAAVVGAAVFLAAGGPVHPAQAKTARADLSLGAGGSGTDAHGRIQFKQKRRGERLKIRLDNLQPRTDYEVRDGATDDVLGTVRTDRRGRAKKTLRAGPGRSLSGALLEICEPGSDDPVLEGQVPSDDSGKPGFDGSFLVGTVSTDPDASVQVSITLSSTTGGSYQGDPAVGVANGFAPDGSDGSGGDDAGGGRETYESISLFAGPGGVWAMGMETPPGGGQDTGEGDDGGFPGFPSIPGPVTFWIADGENGLVQVAVIEKGDFGQPIPLGMPVSDGGFDGTIFPMPDSYSWYADNLSEPGLPLGVGAISDLSGRAFEVRDGEGTVLFEGVLPELEAIAVEPMPEPMPEPEPMPWPGLPCPGGDFNIDITINFPGFEGGEFDLEKWLQSFKF